ncbi:hypothetical protein [Luteimonas huabeiensis]|uniref:hypothetical protein n=1 Tax=Luteimonas huabeiensis TaxID=1244513 RepID=UPI0004670718|nr:hypothetical protein [Luteimonas huabeiensis]
MAYADLRRAIIAQGWQPTSQPDCKRNVVGGDFERICAHTPNRCEMCDRRPELEICSGDGHCLLRFASRDGRQTLTINTYGTIEDAEVSGDASRLRVPWWDVQPAERNQP